MRLLACLLPLTLLAGCSCSTESAGADLRAADREPMEGLLFPDRPGAGQDGVITDSATSPDDWDGDGLSNTDEPKLGTNPWNRDTDGDGKDDKTEVGGDIAKPKDGDGDGRPDALEPSGFDSDGDGTPDEADKEEALCPLGTGTPRLFVNKTRDTNLKLVTSCSPYRVLSQLTMTSGALLEAEAGVEVQFGPGAALVLGNNTTTASLKLNGTVTAPVVFTSTATTAKKGDWQGVVVEQASSLSLNQVKIAYAGAQDPGHTDPRAALLVKSAASIELTKVTLEHIAGAGLHAGISKGTGALFGAFTGCTFTDLDGAAAVLDIRHLGEIGADNSFAMAGPNAVVEVRQGLVTSAATWKAVGIPYQLEEDTLTVDAPLVLAAGVKVIFAPDTVVNVGYDELATGSLTTEGTESAPVTLQTATPTPGSWQGLVLYGGTSAQPHYNTLSYTTIRGAGQTSATGKSASIYLDKDASLTATAVTISESDGLGVYLYVNGSFPEGCALQTSAGYNFVGTFPGDTEHVGCKFLCQDDTQATCLAP